MFKAKKELLNTINSKKKEIEDNINDWGMEEVQKAQKELDELQAKYSLMDKFGDQPDTPLPEDIVPLEPKDSIHEFAEAARHGFAVDYNNEGTNADGGYTVPEDIQTRINKWKEAKFSLEMLVDHESVSTLSGRRTYMKRAQHTGFEVVDEAGKIKQKDGPQFEILEYKVKKYAGYLPVTNELLADSDANIANVLIEWLGEENLATRNAIVLALLKQAEETDLANLDGIKKAVNVTLGQAYAGNIKIVSNDDGLQYLDTLKDENGQYLLKPELNPQSPIPYRLAVGATTIPIAVVPNSTLASDGTKVPFYIGDFKEAFKIFDRAQLSIMTSNIAAIGTFNAFEQDMTLFRGIERLDAVIKDADAYVRGYIDTAAGNP